MRCNLTCPHGDRCSRPVDHDVDHTDAPHDGCCMPVCPCNEPNKPEHYEADDNDGLPRSDGKTRYRWRVEIEGQGSIDRVVTVESVTMQMKPPFRVYNVRDWSDGSMHKAKITELYPFYTRSDLKDTQPIRRVSHQIFCDVARIDREAFAKAAESLATDFETKTLSVPIACNKAPSECSCSRELGHEGPCAARVIEQPMTLQEANAYPNHCWRCSRHIRTGMVGVEDHAEGCPGRSIVFVHPKHAASMGATVHGSGWGDGWVQLTPTEKPVGDALVKQRVDSFLKQRTDACEKVLRTLSTTADPETPDRMARALRDLTDGYDVDVEKLLRTFPVDGDHGMVVVRDIPFASLCEHHVLPFNGTASVVYVPHNQVIGLSKIPRLVRAYSRRLQIQERIGMQVADAIMRYGHAKGVMVVIRGRHSCMALRGAESPGEMVTSCVRGCLEQEPAARAEALELLR